MKNLFSLLLVCMSALAYGQITDVRINEVDQDQPGTDTLEFVELFGAPNLPLDGLVLVFFNGAGDVSYDVYDLDGYTTDELGFFLLGSPQLPNIDATLNPNAQGSIQNGQDAIALYEGNGADWPSGSPLSSCGSAAGVTPETLPGPAPRRRAARRKRWPSSYSIPCFNWDTPMSRLSESQTIS
jgi:hypothetical protein